MFCRIKPKATAKMEAAFAQYYEAKKDETGRVFTPIQLFDEKQQETQSFHFIFVLDESGSMGPHWSSLETAYQGFLTRRNNDQGGHDHFTVVLFDHNARTILLPRQRLSNTPNNLPTLNGGGTAYTAGLKEAQKTIAADKTRSSIVMIFMSDGANDVHDGDPVALIHQFKQSYGKDHNFICHTVGFGSGVASESPEAQLLAKMASAGGGQTYSALNGAQLNNVFGRIAANSTTSDALVARFSEILAREISVKIMVDYL
jgi:Mg-chelatase subunit ChlD